MLEGEYNKGQVILSRNRLFMKGKRFQILLPEDLQAEAVFGGGSETELFLPIGGLVFRKTWIYP